MSGRVLAEARRLVENATPGPWRVGEFTSKALGDHRVVYRAEKDEAGKNWQVASLYGFPNPGIAADADAEFIAAARSLLPSLLDFAEEVARLCDEDSRLTYRGTPFVFEADLRAALSRLASSAGREATMAERESTLTTDEVAALIAELMQEWRETCKQMGMGYTDKDAARFIAEAYPCNRLTVSPASVGGRRG